MDVPPHADRPPIRQPPTPQRIGVVGTGSFGTALALHWTQADRDVVLWSRRPAFAETLRTARVNEAYLPGVALPEALRITDDLRDLRDCEAIVVAVPSHGFREVVRQLLSALPPNRVPVVVSATKGIETESLARMSQVTFEEAIATDRNVHFAVLAGPSFASELAQGVPTAAVLACGDGDLAQRLRDLLATKVFRIYSSTDVVGVELGGTTKNVIAIAAGVLTGLGLGQNTQAALITRGLHEVTRLCLACGGQPRTLAGLAGLGDLVLTCTGGLSRNRQLGLALARGRTVEDALAGSMVAEGVRNSLAVARLAARQRVEMPITEQMVQVLHHGKSPRLAVEELMMRAPKEEAEL